VSSKRSWLSALNQQYDVIVVGGASAGLTAALYTARQSLRTLVITKDIGGQALLTNSIQNYPGYTDISGFELMTKFQEQAALYGAEFLYDEVLKVNQAEEGCFSVGTKDKEFQTCSVILAFGKTPRDLGVPGEQRFKGKGVSYCAVCDGPLFKGKVVAVVGSGDPALEAANYLAGVAAKVYIVQRTQRPIGDEELIQNLKSMKNVEFVNEAVVSSINGGTKLESLTIHKTAPKGDHSPTQLEVDGLFVEMGYVTKTDFIRNLVELNSLGEIIVDKNGATSMPGVFACGDVTDTLYKQAIVSAGQGAAAALSAYNYIQRLRGKSASKADWKSIKLKPTTSSS
jgi:thioredoxin reductase (NADPH)